MYIFRWLMKHPIIILALYFLSIVAILFSMTGGGSKDSDSVDTAEVQTVTSGEVDLKDAPAIEPSTLTTALVTGNESDEAASTDINKVAETEGTDTVKVTSESLQETAQEAKVENTAALTKVASDTTEVTSGTIEEVATDTTTKAIAEGSETSTQFSEMNEEELLLMAREAYWNNGLDESAQIYQKLIEVSPDVIDYQGELGNVYWRQGFPKKAAELYSAISIPMLEAGDAERVANMVGFIGLFYPEKATELHNRLQNKK